MAYRYSDENTGVDHIKIAGSTLCGLLDGWTRVGDKPVKEKWDCTCDICQEELEDLRKIKK